MDNPEHTSFRLTHKQPTHIRTTLKVLGAIQALLMLWPIADLVKGTSDTYHNEHLRSLASSLTGVLVTGSILIITGHPTSKRASFFSWGLLVLSLMSVFWSHYLAR